jgi:hypothetical protein
MAVMALALLASQPAVAFGPDRGGEARDGERSGHHDEGPDYQFSGPNFNFSMSRRAAPSDDSEQKRADNADEQQDKPQQRRPGFFQRILHSLFGN